MAAAALRSVANKLCGRPPLRLQPYFTAAVKEEQGWLLPSRLRRFSSSESPPNLINKKQLPCGGATNNAAEHTESLGLRVEEKKRELLHLLRQMEHPHAAAMEENKKLLDLLRGTPQSSSWFVPDNMFKITVFTTIVTAAVFYVETKYIMPVFGARKRSTSENRNKH